MANTIHYINTKSITLTLTVTPNSLFLCHIESLAIFIVSKYIHREREDIP